MSAFVKKMFQAILKSVFLQGATRVGKVGDRILIARSKGPAGKPTLEVIKTKNITKGRGKNFASVMRDEITYKNL